MHGYDDSKALGEYLAVFSTAGDIPTSQGGYGIHPQVYRRALQSGGLGAASSDSPILTFNEAKREGLRTTGPETGVKAIRLPLLQWQLRAVHESPRPGGRSKDGFVETKQYWDEFVRVFNQPGGTMLPGQTEVGPDWEWAFVNATALGKLQSMFNSYSAADKDKYRKAGSKTAPKTTSKTSSPSPRISVNVAEMQQIMIALGADPARIQDGKYGPTTKRKWTAITKTKGVPTFSGGRTGARTAKVNRRAWATLKAAATEAAPVAKTDMVASTSDVQSLLKRLGYKDAQPGRDALGDGIFGKFTRQAWQEAANKRNLDPFIANKSADGKQVAVRKTTYLNLRADADAKVAPAEPEPAGGTLRTLDPKLVTKVGAKKLGEVLGRITRAPKDAEVRLFEVYKSVAENLGVDPRIENLDAQTALVLKKSWDAVMAKYASMTPPEPPPGPEKTQLELMVEGLVRDSTSKVGMRTVRRAINAAIINKVIEGDIIKTGGGWDSSLRPAIIEMIDPKKPEVFERALVKGKLVTKSGGDLKLPPSVAEIFKTAAARLQAKKKAEAERIKGYREVNAAQVIARINNLGVSETKFDKSGGPYELADAIKTFFDETDHKAPSGDLVRTSKNKVYLKKGALVALALAVKEADNRAAATKAYRAGMVDAALKSMTADMTVQHFQQALRHLVLSKQAGKDEKTYKKVKITGAFDKPTRAAYTLIARTLTIGPSVQEYQGLLGAQRGMTTAQINARVKEVRNQVWNEVLDKAARKTEGKLKIAMLPVIAERLKPQAELYRQNVSADMRAAQEAAEQRKLLQDAVKRSTATLSMLGVQQGLKQRAAKGLINPTGVKITNSAGRETRDGLRQLSALIFPEGYDLPETMWMAYLKQVGKRVVPGGKVTPTWVGANYISLPPDLANMLAKNAGEWIAKHGEANIQVVEFNHPSVITVTRAKSEQTFTEQEASAQIQEPAEEPIEERVERRAEETVSSEQPTAPAQDDEAARARAEAERRAREQAAQAEAERRAAEAARKARLAEQQAEAERAAKERAAAEAEAAAQAAREAQLREQAAREAGRRREAEQAAAEARRAAATAEARAQEAQQAAARESASRQEQTAQETAAQGGAGGGAKVTGPTINITSPQAQAAPQKAGLGMGAAALGVGGLALLLYAMGDKGEQQR